jgi:uroporphyrin-III C-methyltransferase
MTVSLLTATNSTGHIHLIIGSKPLAAARCAKSLEVGAKPIVISNADQEDVHFRLREMIDKGQVDWIKRGFQDEDLDTLGREEIDNFVDAVFVTTGPRDNLGK